MKLSASLHSYAVIALDEPHLPLARFSSEACAARSALYRGLGFGIRCAVSGLVSDEYACKCIVRRAEARAEAAVAA